jgi:hypothetical protein
LAGISDERTKFHHIISQLDHRYSAEVEDIITSPHQQNPYTKLRTELLNQLSPSKKRRDCHVLTLEEMDNRKPLELLRHVRSLAPYVPDYSLRSIWTSRYSQR